MGHIGNGQQQFTLLGIKGGDLFVSLLDTLGNLLHLRDQSVGDLFFFLEAGDFVSGFIALGFQLFGCGNELAALLVELAEAVQIQGHAALPGHVGEDVQVVTEVAKIMHGVKRIP